MPQVVARLRARVAEMRDPGVAAEMKALGLSPDKASDQYAYREYLHAVARARDPELDRVDDQDRPRVDDCDPKLTPPRLRRDLVDVARATLDLYAEVERDNPDGDNGKPSAAVIAAIRRLAAATEKATAEANRYPAYLMRLAAGHRKLRYQRFRRVERLRVRLLRNGVRRERDRERRPQARRRPRRSSASDRPRPADDDDLEPTRHRAGLSACAVGWRR